MENKEIEFTIKANTKPIEDSMSKLVDDIADGKKSMSQFAEELESCNNVKLDKIGKVLYNELVSSKVIVKDIENELQKLNNEKMEWYNPPVELVNSIKNAESELGIAQEQANNFSEAMDTVKIANGMNNIDETFKDFIANLRYGVGDMQEFTALIENADKHELRDITANLRAGLNDAEVDLQDLQFKLISAIQTQASPTAVENIRQELTLATTSVNEFKRALAMVGKVGSSQGGILTAIFTKIKGKIDGVKAEVEKVSNRFKRMAISSVIFAGLGALRSGLREAGSLSESATNKFTAMSNVIAGSLIPVVEAFATAVRKAIVWVAGLVKYITGFDMLQAGIDATKKNIDKLGASGKKAGKQMKDGLLSSLDEINNIEPSQGGGSSGSGDDMTAQLGALGELESMMAEMSALDFSWAEPLKAFWEFLKENGEVIAIILGAIAVAVAVVNVAMWALSANPVVLIIAGIIVAIGLLIAIIVLLIKHWDEIWSKVKEIASNIWDRIKQLGEDLATFFKELWEGIVILFTPVVEFFTNLFTSAWEGIKSAWSGVVDFFKLLWEGIKAIFNFVVEYYRTIFTTAWNVIKNVWSVVVNWFKGIWDGIKNVFSAVGNWFSTVFTNAYNGVVNVFSKITGFFKGIWESIKAIFSKVGEVVGGAITDTVKKAVNTVLSTAVKIINGFISAINVAIGVINAIPGVNIKKLSKLEVPSFDVGTNYVPEDMIAMVHKGERITPAKYNNDDWVGQEVDMSETNDLISDLIDVVRSKNLSISADEIGRASVSYINNESRRRGESVI